MGVTNYLLSGMILQVGAGKKWNMTERIQEKKMAERKGFLQGGPQLVIDSYNAYKWPYRWVNGIITVLNVRVLTVTLLIT